MLGRLLAASDGGFHPAGDLAPREQDPPPATRALESDVGAQAHHDPVQASTRVGLAQSQHICHAKIGEHARHSEADDYSIRPHGRIRICMLGLSASLLVTRLLTLVIAFTVHEFSHAWTATQLGDDTPRLSGRLTLNPLAHLDPLGSLLLVVAGFGWAKPVPVNPYAVRSRTPAGMMLVSAAGPFSNLVMAILAAIPFRAGLITSFGPAQGLLPSIGAFLLEFIYINLILLLFNLIPLFPLDGEKVISFFLPPNLQAGLERLRPYGPMILFGLFFLGSFASFDVLGTLVSGPALRILRLLIS
jgi:Zn-dependent protease